MEGMLGSVQDSDLATAGKLEFSSALYQGTLEPLQARIYNFVADLNVIHGLQPQPN